MVPTSVMDIPVKGRQIDSNTQEKTVWVRNRDQCALSQGTDKECWKLRFSKASEGMCLVHT